MKKFAFATLLALSATTAFAGFQDSAQNAQGGFQHGFTQPISVKQALSAKDNSMVTLVGNITRQIDDDEYMFTDGTAEIKIEIERHIWNGLNVGPQDKLRIMGKLDNEAFERADIEVLRVEKVN